MRRKPLSLLLCLMLALTACGPREDQTTDTSSAASQSATSSSDGSAATDGGQSVPPEDQSGGLTPLTEEELVAAHEAAYAYYKNTVFEVSTLVEIEPPEGEIAFRVSCSKGGEDQPDRTICLERRDGVWTVINEGY